MTKESQGDAGLNQRYITRTGRNVIVRLDWLRCKTILLCLVRNIKLDWQMLKLDMQEYVRLLR